ncbi:MAG: hypothetical protein K0B87_02015 [Candidatus Syntrophosphaera sp.]|nr:hypothetical protein [Candidatus Syntrophosphaera sp.]
MRNEALFCLLFLAYCTLSAQYADWLNYTPGRVSRTVDSVGDQLWCATSGGLVRIDRHTMGLTHLNHANSGLPFNNVRGLKADPAGNIWIWGQYTSLWKYDGQTWQSFPLGFMYNSINSLAIAGADDIWLGTDAGGLVHFDGTSFTQYTDYTSNTTPNAESVTLDNIGRVWFSTYDWVSLSGMLVCRDGDDCAYYHHPQSALPGTAVNAIAFDAANHLWIGTFSAGAYYYDDATWTYYHPNNSPLLGSDIYSLALHPDGSVWIGTNSALNVFDGQNWDYYNTGNSAMLANAVYQIFFDDESTSWFPGSMGLNRLQGGVLQVINTSNSNLPSSPLYCQVESADGVQWIGGFAGLYRFDGENWSYLETPGTYHQIWDMALDQSGNLWLATRYDGLIKYDGNEFTQFTSDNSPLPNNLTAAVGVDSQNRVWLATQRNGLFRLDGGTWTSWDTSNSILPSNYLLSLSVDELDQVWVGAYNTASESGLVRIAGDNWTLYDTSNSGLPSNAVTEVVYLNGAHWISTSQGLACLSGNEWTVYNTDNSSLPHDVVTGLAAGLEGALWVSTQYGGLARYADGAWTVFGSQNSGLASNICKHVCVDATNRLWIGHYYDGISVYTGGQVSLQEEFQIPVPSFVRTWPNPFTDRICFGIDEPKGSIEITLFNLRGQKVGEWNFPARPEIVLDLNSLAVPDLPNGVWLWKVSTSGRTGWLKTLCCK